MLDRSPIPFALGFALEVETVAERHVVILNKYPVQIGHLLADHQPVGTPIGLVGSDGLVSRQCCE